MVARNVSLSKTKCEFFDKTLRVISGRTASVLSVAIWLLLQLIIIGAFWNSEQFGDSKGYIEMATDCFNNGKWYPNEDYLHSSYIWAPGLINLLIFQLKVFGTLKVNFFFNLLMNIGILWNVYLLAKRFFNQRTAYLSVTLFCWLFSNILIVLPVATEIPFLFLSLSAFNLFLTRKGWALILAGILFALANWIRPLVVVFLFVVLLWMLLKKYSLRHYVQLLLPFILLIFSIGWMANKQFGHFVTQSTTSGVNLIMTCNDRAYGGVATSLLADSTSTCYIKDAKKYTFKEINSIYMKRSINWMKEHPVKTVALYAIKIPGLYIEDSWPERRVLAGGSGFVDKAVHGSANHMDIVNRIINMLVKSIVYYIVMILFLISIIKYRKDLLTDKGYVVLILLLGTLATCVFSVGPAYHYPYLFAAIIWASYYIDRNLAKKEEL
jgi:hypothetical protein